MMDDFIFGEPQAVSKEMTFRHHGAPESIPGVPLSAADSCSPRANRSRGDEEVRGAVFQQARPIGRAQDKSDRASLTSRSPFLLLALGQRLSVDVTLARRPGHDPGRASRSRSTRFRATPQRYPVSVPSLRMTR